MKRCPKCGLDLPLSAFGKQKSRADGLRHVCKTCNAAAARVWHRANPERAAAGSKRWAEANPERYRENQRRWREQNRERDLANKRAYGKRHSAEAVERAKAWAEANPEKRRAVLKKYRDTHKDEQKERVQAWHARNKGHVRGRHAKNRAVTRHAMPAWLSAIQLAQIQEFYDIAVALTTQTGIPYEVDHIHPLHGRNFRGLHTPWNLQILTAEANNQKANSLPEGI